MPATTVITEAVAVLGVPGASAQPGGSVCRLSEAQPARLSAELDMGPAAHGRDEGQDRVGRVNLSRDSASSKGRPHALAPRLGRHRSAG